MKKEVILFFFVVILAELVYSQNFSFEKTYGGALSDSGVVALQTADGGYLIAGRTANYGAGLEDFCILKIDECGDSLWTKTYGGPESESLSSMIKTNDGNYALWGFTKSYGQLHSNFYLVKINPIGDTLWTKTYTGVTSSNYLKSNDLVQCPDSGFILSGSRNYTGSFGNTYGYTIRTNALGDELWTNSYQRHFTFPGFEDTTLNKDLIITGDYSSSTSRDIVIRFIDPSTGYTISQILFDNNGNWEEGYAILPLIQGGCLISGYTGYSNSFKAYIIRTDANYNKLWDKQFNYGELHINQNFPTGRKDFKVIQTGDLGFAFLGRVHNSYDIKLIKTDSSGVEEWSQTYGGPDLEEPSSFIQTADKGFAIVGYTKSYGAGGKDTYFIKTDSLGFAPAYSSLTDNESICNGDSIFWHNNYYNTTGTYYDSLLSVNGCDSIYKLNLIANTAYSSTETQSISDTDSLLWHTNYYKTTGTYYDSLLTVNGCDSIYELNLIINPSYYIVDNESTCDSDSLLWRTNYYKTTGTYYDSLLTINGSDSIYELNLIINPSYYTVDNESICDGDSLLWHTYYYKTTGTYYDSLLTVNGCDSIYELNLIVNPSYYTVDNESICDGDSIFWHNNFYNTTDIYYDSLYTVNTCDSIFELNLIVYPNHYFIENEYISDGDSILWQGSYYDATGQYFEDYHTTNFCDSIYMLNLDVIVVTLTGTSFMVSIPNLFYQWLDCNNSYAPIIGETGQSFTPTANGNYAVEISGNNFIDTSACYSITSVGLNKKTADLGIMIYPNPTSGIVTIKGQNILDIELMNIQGQLIQKLAVKENRLKLNLSQQAKGSYLIKIITKKGTAVEKIVLE